MLWIADFEESINQRALPFGLECNIELGRGAGGRVAQTLPVDWNSIPGVLDPHVIPT